MSMQIKEVVIGDVVKFELPHEYCRESRIVSRDLAATVGLNVGEVCEPDTLVAQIHTSSTALTADGGSYKLGYKGQWSAAIAWDANAAAVKAAFELLSTVTDTVTASAALSINGSTLTWTTGGPKDEVEVDARLLLDGAVVMSDLVCPVSTIGSLVASMVIVATGGNATGILLEKVTLADLLTGNNIERAFLVRGSSIVDSDQLTVLAAQKATALAALVALGIQMRVEPTIYQSGPPTAKLLIT